MSKKIPFKSVEAKPDFPRMEKELLDWWYKTGIVDRYLHKNDKAKRTFSFMDGPITANNPMGVHHGWGRTYKDVWQRYNNMLGCAQRFQNGFDCQGLWVEVEVEKELGFKSKKDIEKFGIAKFVKLCKKRVLKFAKVQTEQSKRLGYFMDWNNSYMTMSDENNYMIWYFLKKCWQKGFLYKGRDSVPWCPRCGTAISQHEMLTEDYKTVTHKSIYFKLPILTKGYKDTYFLVWTTTPWTIPANVALVVDPKINYLMIGDNGQTLILSENRAKALFASNLVKQGKKIKGSKLLGLTYQGPFDHLPRVKKSLGSFKHKVIPSDPLILPVEEAEGTGLVHIATGGGTEDFAIGKKEKLPVIEVISEEANYLDGMEEFSGKNAKKQPELILDFVKEYKNGKYFYKLEKFTHRYPACWRCKEELVWRVVNEWYIAMDKVDPADKRKRTLRQEMIDVAKKIKWIPSFGLKRELDWLNNMHDWLISKKRYWGLALPIWECKCGHFEVIGSKEELLKKTVKGKKIFVNKSPHRPWVDKLKIKCPKCGKLATRVLDVGNPWLDAGIVSFSTLIDPELNKLSYINNKQYFKRWFPADFITESFPGQFKNWFYSMIAMSTVLENKPPYKTVLGFGTLLGEDGRPMHKSWGNAIEFNEGADKIGVDVMRWMYLNHDPKKNLLFGYKIADETRRKFHLMLWNIYKFFVTYSNLDEWEVKQVNFEKLAVLDRWILSKLKLVIVKVTKSLDAFKPDKAASEIGMFVLDLSTWYIRRSRDRVGPMAKDNKDKENCYSLLYYILTVLSRLLAPFTPFIAEKIYRNLSSEESVHLADWPCKKEEGVKKEDKKLIKLMKEIRQVCELGHAKRKELNLKVRQPLAKLVIKNDKLCRLLSRVCTIKISAKTQLKSEKELIKLITDELNVKKIEFQKGKDLKIEFDTKITPALRQEGEARELIRQIQNLRKKTNCNLDEKIFVSAPSWPKPFEKEIKDKALISKLRIGKQLKLEKSKSS